VLAVLIVATGTWNYLRPLPAISASPVAIKTYAAKQLTLDWPVLGQAAIATAGQGVLATHGPQTPLATASIAKVITALLLLQKYPLQPGQSGPTLTLTAADVDLYYNYLANDGSVVAVQAGQQLTEYQLLEGMLLPSANNLADTAAIWAYGSLAAYHDAANQYLATHGLTDTHVAIDASGLNGATTSTASNLAQLGQLTLAEPVLAEIVAKPSAYLPTSGTVYNYNTVLGEQGIIGIKTGNNDQDPGAFLFAAKLPVGSSTVTVTGAIMGADSLYQALQSSLPLLASVQRSFSHITVAEKGQPIATYRAPWGATAHAVAADDLSVLRWEAQPLTVTTTLEALDGDYQATDIGRTQARLTHEAGQVELRLDHPLAKPSFWWRLTRH
jgi:D-alanyl-D-alanine carboxypeptidase (penicillin-binding protein 5/6)